MDNLQKTKGKQMSQTLLGVNSINSLLQNHGYEIVKIMFAVLVGGIVLYSIMRWNENARGKKNL